MYPAIRSDDEQAFDNMNDESGKKKTFSFTIYCGLFQVKASLSRPKKRGSFRPHWGNPG